MNFSSKIKQFSIKFKLGLWPLPEHKPSGKPAIIEGSKILLLFNYSTMEEILLLGDKIPNIKRHLSTSSLITICNMCNIPLPNENLDIVSLSLNDYNLLGKPKLELNDLVKKNEFDILFSFANEGDSLCNNLVSSIKAGFKVGVYNPDNVKLYDLTIKQESDDISKQLELITHYLNKLNINK